MQNTKSGFSLIEILMGMLIVSIVMISAFQAISSLGVAKIKLIEQTEVEKQAYFSSERFFEMIKKGGTIDYEEYWNRYSYSTSYGSGHFDIMSGFGNFGTTYHCVSGDLLVNKMGTGGCLSNDPNYENSLGTDFRDQHQRYTQYSLQFIDRNSDFDNDGGDEDGDLNILGDDDDSFLGIGPEAFSGSLDKNKVGELYLINAQGNERTYFRWRVETASGSFVPAGADCDYTDAANPVGEACQGTIEFLKLTGQDYGYDHGSGSLDTDGSQADGIVDTWLIHEDFNSTGADIIAGSNLLNYWQAIFPDSINVSGVEFYTYPNKSLEYSWRDSDESIFIAPYIQVKMTLQPSIKEKRKIQGKIPEVKIATTIQLSSLDLK